MTVTAVKIPSLGRELSCAFPVGLPVSSSFDLLDYLLRSTRGLLCLAIRRPLRCFYPLSGLLSSLQSFSFFLQCPTLGFSYPARGLPFSSLLFAYAHL